MKKTKAPKGARCTSTASGGVLKCALEGEHEVHSTVTAGRNRKGQHATWSTIEDGRIQVITYSGGKRQSDWYEDAPKAAKPCGDTLAGIECTQPKGHAGDHVGKGGAWSRDRKSAQFDCAPEHDEREDDDEAAELEVPAKGRDVGMAVAQGETRPIREVLDERKKHHNAQGKALREQAFRVRAGMHASLASCLCCYPLVKAETESEHEEWCPSHGMHLSWKAIGKFAAEAA